jgi:hypothetical protein
MPTEDDFYREKRYCPSCRTYVQFLSSLRRAHCIQCDGPVQLFSDADREAFQALCRGRDPEDTPRRA